MRIVAAHGERKNEMVGNKNKYIKTTKIMLRRHLIKTKNPKLYLPRNLPTLLFPFLIQTLPSNFQFFHFKRPHSSHHSNFKQQHLESVHNEPRL